MDSSGASVKLPEQTRRLVFDLLWLAAPALYPALHFGAGFLPEALRAVLGFLLIVVLPGWLLHLLILPRAQISLAARVTRTFALGMAVVSMIGLLAWFFGDDVTLQSVSAFSPFPPPLLGRVSAVVWSEATLVFVMAILIIVRRATRRSRPAAAVRSSASSLPGQADHAAAAEPIDRADADGRDANPPVSEGEILTPMQRIVREAYRLGDQHKLGHPVAPRWATQLVLGVIVLAAGALGFYAGGDFSSGRDSLAHVATIREMVEQDRILPRTSFYADGDGAAIDSRMGFFHVALAAVCNLARVPAPKLWLLLPGILAPFGLVIFHTLARRLLLTEGAALFATFMALILFGEAQQGLLTRFAYGNQMGIVLAWATLASGLHFALDQRRRSLLALVALSSLAATATHVFAILLILFSLGVFWVVLLLFHGPRRAAFTRVSLVIAAAIVGAAPILAWRYAFAYAPLNPIHTQRQGILYLTQHLYVIMPKEWASELMGIGFGGIFLSLFLWKRAREDDRVLYLAALSLAPLLVVANPLIVPVLEPVLGYLVARFIVATPFIIVLAYIARWMGESFLELNSARRVAKSVLVYAFMIWLLFPRLEAFARSYLPERLAANQERSVLAWSSLLTSLDKQIGRPAVILSDPFTSYSIPALTHHYTVAVLHQHASPSDSLGIERLAACRDVLSPYLGTGEKARLCRRFNVDYVLVNGVIDRPLRGYFATAGPQVAPAQLAALTADEALFQRLWDFGGRESGLFRVRHENLDALCGIVTPGSAPPALRRTEDVASAVLLRRLPSRAIPVLADTLCGVTLAAASFDTTLLAREEGTTVTLYWRRVGPADKLPLVNYVRLDTPAPRGPLWLAGLSKIHRRLLHSRDGEIFRVQMNRQPLEGMFGPEYWPRDRYVVDPVHLRLPPGAVPGEYAVHMKWMSQTFLTNLPLAHFLTDRDALSGTVIGVLEVY